MSKKAVQDPLCRAGTRLRVGAVLHSQYTEVQGSLCRRFGRVLPFPTQGLQSSPCWRFGRVPQLLSFSRSKGVQGAPCRGLGGVPQTPFPYFHSLEGTPQWTLPNRD